MSIYDDIYGEDNKDRGEENRNKRKPLQSWWDMDFWVSNHYRDLLSELDSLERQGKIVLPAEELQLRAFEETPWDKVKAVIVGQDPYPRKSCACGLAFSVPPKLREWPASLKKILNEYQSDLKVPDLPRTGDLSSWAAEGVLLFNTYLTTEPHRPLAHEDIGWQWLTYEVLTRLSYEKENLVFIMWGLKAQMWRPRVDENKHLVIAGPHPAARDNSFYGHKPFSTANIYLRKKGKPTINWRLR